MHLRPVANILYPYYLRFYPNYKDSNITNISSDSGFDLSSKDDDNEEVPNRTRSNIPLTIGLDKVKYLLLMLGVCLRYIGCNL